MIDQPTAQTPPRPFRYRHDGVTPERQEQFCAALRETGFVAHAARAVGVSTISLRRARERMPAFARAWNEALAAGRAGSSTLDPGLSELGPLARSVYANARAAWGEPSIQSSGSGGARRPPKQAELNAALAIEKGMVTARQRRQAPDRRRATTEETDAAILRKFAALRRHNLCKEAAEAERLLREGKIP